MAAVRWSRVVKPRSAHNSAIPEPAGDLALLREELLRASSSQPRRDESSVERPDPPRCKQAAETRALSAPTRPALAPRSVVVGLAFPSSSWSTITHLASSSLFKACRCVRGRVVRAAEQKKQSYDTEELHGRATANVWLSCIRVFKSDMRNVCPGMFRRN